MTVPQSGCLYQSVERLNQPQIFLCAVERSSSDIYTNVDLVIFGKIRWEKRSRISKVVILPPIFERSRHESTDYIWTRTWDVKFAIVKYNLLKIPATNAHRTRWTRFTKGSSPPSCQTKTRARNTPRASVASFNRYRLHLFLSEHAPCPWGKYYRSSTLAPAGW